MALYTLAYPQPDSIRTNLKLVIALQGFADAGHSVQIFVDYLRSSMELIPLAEFDSDLLVDYRGRRPSVTLDDTFVIHIDEANPVLYLCRDTEGNEFLLLAGFEPDFQWKSFARAVRDLVHHYKVGHVVSLYAAPFPVPHTRQQLVSAHSTEPEVLANHLNIGTTRIVPGAAALFAEHFLIQTATCSVTGLTAHVPQYIANSDYPPAVVEFLESINNLTGTAIPMDVIRDDATKVLEALDDLVENGELAEVVGDLEKRYDRMMSDFESRVLSQDDIDAEVAKFLAELDGDD
ncbi:MAG: PAC2 family protein [Corynebacterium sp.]|nr:PAC2 family protein [Corynebacterium sp.]